MNIWSSREKSLSWLNNELQPEREVIQEGFDILGNIAQQFEEIGQTEGESELGQFCRISSITLAKFCHLLLGCYSLVLDGLAQEAGALLRPLIETLELLAYFRLDKKRINQVIQNKLPSAGKIGKLISGEFQDLRDHLNENASHFSFQKDSLRHILDENVKIQLVPNHSLKVFRKNLLKLNTFQFDAMIEAVRCLNSIKIDSTAIVDKINKWHNACIKVFPPE